MGSSPLAAAAAAAQGGAMRIDIIALLVAGQISFATPSPCGDQTRSEPLRSALNFFDASPSSNVDSTLRALRTKPVSLEQRNRARATLPPDGALRPTPGEIAKIEALRPVLIYHERDRVFDTKVIDVPQAVVALHARAILIISRPALKVLTVSQLRALVAHEVGHDFLWEAFDSARFGPARQQLEMECDGIAALTLVALGLKPRELVDALSRIYQFNEQFGAPTHAGNYPPITERERFISALLAGHRFALKRPLNRRP
jgi:hypothetical protein